MEREKERERGRESQNKMKTEKLIRQQYQNKLEKESDEPTIIFHREERE